MGRDKKRTVLMCVFLISLGIVACGQIKEEFAANQQESDMQTAESTDPETFQQESDMQTVESMDPDTFSLGEYQDDMGSQLIIAKADDKKYIVTFGIYKLAYMENAEGNYDADSGVLSFSGTDDMGKTLSADVTMEGEDLIVTLTHSEYDSTCPIGTTFRFEPYQP